MKAAPAEKKKSAAKAPKAKRPRAGKEAAEADVRAAEADVRAAEATPEGKAPKTPSAIAEPKPKPAKAPRKGRGRPGRKPVIRFEVEEEDEAEAVEEEEYGPEGLDELIADTIPAVRKRRRKVKSSAKALKRRRKLLRKRKRERAVRPSPPLEETDPLGAYMAGQMVPCPVGCGGFSEVVRIATLDSGAGEVWFECLSCAQRRPFQIPPATADENAAIGRAEEAGHEPRCQRHADPVHLRRRGRQFACPACGVVYTPPNSD